MKYPKALFVVEEGSDGDKFLATYKTVEEALIKLSEHWFCTACEAESKGMTVRDAKPQPDPLAEVLTLAEGLCDGIHYQFHITAIEAKARDLSAALERYREANRG